MLVLFWVLFEKLVPLYLLIAAGYVAGRFLRVTRENLASLLIYLIVPIVVFNSLLTIELDWSRLSLPVLFFILCCSICLLTLKIGSKVWSGPTKNIAAFSSASGNTGYFGLPVAAFLFGEQVLGLVVLSAFGFILFENTLGYFVTARGHHTARESLRRVVRLPTVYAFLAGLALNLAGVRLTGTFQDLYVSFRGAYSVLGMMMIGLGVATLRRFEVNWKYLAVTFSVKFLVWPVTVFSLVALDRAYLGFYDPMVHKIMVLMAIVPLPANSVALAAELRTDPEQAGVAVLASTLFALGFIPLIVGSGLI